MQCHENMKAKIRFQVHYEIHNNGEYRETKTLGEIKEEKNLGVHVNEKLMFKI